MRIELLEILRCPTSGSRLSIEHAEYRNDTVHSGWLVSAVGGHRYPIRDFIPRFVPESNYADNFGMQWNAFRQTQLDSHSKLSISGSRFWQATGWTPERLASKWVLDAGCGAGRFAEVALNAGANVVALDYSSAVDACFENLKHHPKLHVVQGDIYALPFKRESFPFVYSLGVLQHTPNVARAFASLPPMVSPGGRLCTDFYWKRLRSMIHAKYVLRPITTRLPRQTLFSVLRKTIPIALPISQALGRIPLGGRALKRLIPIADYTGVHPLSKSQLEEWALLDTFDWFAPEYDNPQTAPTVRAWFEAAAFVDIEVFHQGHLVGRGRKPS
jgi:2-polyprenyl-3-methyl-5-hydroxy-6-metoxy-1,4-benzoquinol methylase